MSTSVRYVGPHPEVDVESLGIHGQKRLAPFEVDDRDVAEGLLARDDFERPPAKKAAARKAAPKTDPADAGDDKPATPASDDTSEEDS